VPVRDDVIATRAGTPVGEPLADQLGRWIRDFSLAEAPLRDELLQRARLHILDGIGVALASSAVPGGIGESLVRHVSSYGSVPAAQLIGTDERAAPALAALFNGSLMHASEHDDTSYERVLHCEAFAVSAILAVGEQRDSTGLELAEAFCVAAETALRLARACRERHALWLQGFHSTAVFGCFGAAAGAAKLLKLDAEGVANALSLATSFASGTNAGWGEASSRNKTIQPGWAALSGIHAALLAATGYSCAHTTIDGPMGLLAAHTFRGEWSREPILERLGDEWSLFTITFKLHAAGSMIQSTLDALERIVSTHDIQPDEVEAVELVVPAQWAPMVRRYHDESYRPSSPYGLAFSWPCTAACMILHRRVGAEHQSEEFVSDPRLTALADKVVHRADTDTSLPLDDQVSFVTVHTARGVFADEQGRNLGYFGAGIGDRVAKKFAQNALLAVDADRVAALRELLLSFKDVTTRDLAALLSVK
jgi:2-methylcitrate dehydratase PrpD